MIDNPAEEEYEGESEAKFGMIKITFTFLREENTRKKLNTQILKHECEK